MEEFDEVMNDRERTPSEGRRPVGIEHLEQMMVSFWEAFQAGERAREELQASLDTLRLIVQGLVATTTNTHDKLSAHLLWHEAEDARREDDSDGTQE